MPTRVRSSTLVTWIVVFIFGLFCLTYGLYLYSLNMSNYVDGYGIREYVDANGTFVRTMFLEEEDRATIEILNDNGSHDLLIDWIDEDGNIVSNEKEFSPEFTDDYTVRIKNSNDYPVEFDIDLYCKYYEDYYDEAFPTIYQLIYIGFISIVLVFIHMSYTVWKISNDRDSSLKYDLLGKNHKEKK